MLGAVVGPVVGAPPGPKSPGIDADATKMVPPSPVVLELTTRAAPSLATNCRTFAANGSNPRRPRAGGVAGPVVAEASAAGRVVASAPAPAPPAPARRLR